MTSSKINLLLACAASAIVSSAAQAQVLLPQVELNGAGASSVADVLPRAANCVGRPAAGFNKLGNKDGTLKTVAPGLYQPAAPTSAQPAAGSTNPTVDCSSAYEIQPDFQAKYISTGSGDGRKMWRTFNTNAVLKGSSNGAFNPFNADYGALNTDPSVWTNLQFAFSDAPLPKAELDEYNTKAAPSAGAAIQFPLYVLPVAFAYNPVYGKKTTGTGTVDLTFKVKVPGKINNLVAGGLRMSADAYCKIFNGEITNWNDPVLKTLNGNTDLRDTVNDTATRWTAEGAPIRLVGRADKSGTTDIFTRALTAQCGGRTATALKFVKAAESLPFNNGSAIDIRNLDATSVYFPASGASNFAGTIQSLSGLVSDKTGKTCLYTELDTTPGSPTINTCTAAVLTNDKAVSGGNTVNAYPGLFTVASGSGNVATAILGTGANSLITSTVDSSIALNGRLGYIGADFVFPSPSRTLHSAALQQGGTGTAYKMPTPTDAVKAFGTVLAPQSTASSGAYDTTDARTLGANDPFAAISGTNPATPVDRANPTHWAAVIYNPNVAVTSTLAAPALGYPLTGVTFFLTSTCFKKTAGSNPNVNAKRFGIVELISLHFGQVTKDSSNFSLNANTFKGVGATNLGIIAKSNIGLVSAGWQNAIKETFLKSSAQLSGGVKLGTRNLWIQDSLPTTASDLDATAGASDSHDNPTCAAVTGA